MGDKLCCEGQRKKNKYNPSIDLERSMLFEGVACAKLLAEVGGQWRTLPLLPITLRMDTR